MNKLLIIIFSFLMLNASDIVLDRATIKTFGKTLNVNAKVVQLSNQRQNIVSRISGHLEQYYVKPGQKVKKGEKIALIKSLELSRLTAHYVYLSKQLEASQKNLESVKKLFKKGLASKKELTDEIIKIAEISANLGTVKSQLSSLDIDPKSVKKATDKFFIHAHADGVISRLLVPVHSNLEARTSIAELVNESGYYAIAYVAVKDAYDLDNDVKGWLEIGSRRFKCSFEQLLPKVDEETQRAQVLFWIESDKEKLLLNAFGEMSIAVKPYKKYVAVKRSALTMFKGEWVVFVPAEEAEFVEESHKDEEEHNHEEHGNDHHDEEDHEKHTDHEDHSSHEMNADHKEHDEHGHEEGPGFVPLVVELLAVNGDDVAVAGIKAGQEYVSEGVYFVKSLLLKSELGGHGH
ncbi:efflux RND transporter periplasmic adaptor subunit [Nitrosophilus alvini]|uniref:efflux RND transporter periplasmic adaptor subunit n=1 Tax=Nitrosophilus alvini TaxID=2714855 RepID=UPI00190E5AF8|nr:efflux RND transporter periplasmic adaptor subunit [Nitrosophilus alvini]